MTEFDLGNHLKFAGGRGEITKIDARSNGGHPINIYTSEEQLRKLPSGLLPIENLDSLVDRLAADQSDALLHSDLRERVIRLNLAYRYDSFLSLSSIRIEIEPYQRQAGYEILISYNHRYLIGDEVCLGKPIEAGIGFEELIVCDRPDVVLIASPAPLTGQWKEGMCEKIYLNLVIYNREPVRTHRESLPKNTVWKQKELNIISIHFSKQKSESLRRERDEEQYWIEEENQVTPEEPDLVTAPFVVPPPAGRC